MRKDVIGRCQTFPEQQAAAQAAGVVIPVLGHRILYNFLIHAETNTYPDGLSPWTFARTSTTTIDSQGSLWPSGCGSSVGPSPGLRVEGNRGGGRALVGAAVALPKEIQSVAL